MPSHRSLLVVRRSFYEKFLGTPSSRNDDVTIYASMAKANIADTRNIAASPHLRLAFQEKYITYPFPHKR